jgi:TonB family protein
MARPRTARRRVLSALALSLLANLFLLTRLDLSWLSQATAVPRPVTMAPLAARDWEANRAVAPRSGEAPRALAPVPPPTPLPEPVPSGQVVNAARPLEPPKEPPKNARFLAEFDSAVEKETRSRHSGLGSGSPAQPSAPARPPGGAAGQPDARADAAAPKPPAEERPRLAFNFQPRGELRRQQLTPSPERSPAPSPAPGAAGPQGLPGADGSDHKLDLRPGAAAYRALGGGSPDKIDGVDEGESTFLNTREWKYAGFFNRIGAEIYPSWVREFRSAAEARDPSGQRFLYRDRETVVNVRLDPQGTLIDVRVIQSSGAPFLDDAVVKAWRETQPFPNVPKGLVNERGEVAFAWSFTVYGVSGSPVQIFLGPNRY